MVYVIGRKSDGSIHYKSGVYCSDGAPTEEAALVAAAGAEDTRLFAYYSTDDAETVQRYRDGWEFSLVWSGDEISGVDFQPELDKPVFEFSTNVSTVSAGGAVTLTITAKTDGGELMLEFSGSGTIPAMFAGVYTPLSVTFDAGVSVNTYTLETAGRYNFPAVGNRFGSVRVGNIATVEAAI